MSILRILVVADDTLARVGLATLLSGQPNCLIAGQISGADDLATARSVYRPDVAVCDLGSDAARALERVNFRDAGFPVLALVPDANAAGEAWASGARSLLPRHAPAEQLAGALAAMAHGLVVLDPAFAEIAILPRESARASIEPLTPRELQVLRLLAEGQSNKTIARTLDISEHTVKFHVNAILGKLNAQSRTEAVVQATRLGLILL